MIVYHTEIADGLSEKLYASNCISYASVVEPSHKTNHSLKNIKSLAALNDSDLYYVQSILVTSSWNKNDDIFDKYEVWNAKNTPEHKPTNLDHNESIIVGHITANWPITDDGLLIDENTPVDNLPNKFHILTGSVIYKGFSNAELAERTTKLIAEIESGTKYVSMECFFQGFDYGLLNKSNGEYKILARNEETAFLTKYLRAYGGMGEHDNYKIGRVLRNITFSGKGFVDKPANPDSIIFNKALFNQVIEDNLVQKNDNLLEIGVFDNQSTSNVENNIMSVQATEAEKIETEEVTTNDNVVADTAVTTVDEPAVVAEQVSNDEVTEDEVAPVVEDAVSAEIAALTEKVNLLETQIASQNETIKILETEKEEAAKKMKEKNLLKEEMAKMEKDMQKVKSELETANQTIAEYKNKEAEMMKKEKKMKRKATLIENGVDSEVADSLIEKFESMEDEAFDAMATLVAGKMPPWLDKKKKDEEDKKDKNEASEDNADPSVLDDVEVVEEVNLGVGGDAESSVEATRAALIDFVNSRLGKNSH
jgi:hypothetical protein